jgi:hypothetical protein
MRRRIGSTLDSLLRETGDLEAVNLLAQKKEFADSVQRHMAQARVGKAELARRMRTSRTVVDRLLDPADTSITLATIAKASAALGCWVKIGLANAGAEARSGRGKARR